MLTMFTGSITLMVEVEVRVVKCTEDQEVMFIRILTLEIIFRFLVENYSKEKKLKFSALNICLT